MTKHDAAAGIVAVLTVALVAGCGRRQTPATAPAPPPPAAAAAPAAPAPPPPPPPAVNVEEALPVPQPLAEDTIADRSLDDLNRDSPFAPVFFGLDSAELDDAGRSVVTANAQLLRQYSTWGITIEGHCDERGTVEYNLALGERRAVAVGDVPRVARHLSRPDQNRQLRQGVPL